MTVRRLIAAMLTLVLLITSGTMAVARGHMASTAVLHVLCIDGDTQVVALGPDGAPVEDRVACPDCVMGALLALGSSAQWRDLSEASRAADPALPPRFLLQCRVFQAALARAPPRSV
ncbi:MAG: hypothetical protein QNI90_14655 [Dinoroseobacter sp.]|nr:hypothetical protein [Dinoroseobacter sp.]